MHAAEVVELAERLPELVLKDYSDWTSITFRGRGFAWVNHVANTAMIKSTHLEREAMIGSDPETFSAGWASASTAWVSVTLDDAGATAIGRMDHDGRPSLPRLRSRRFGETGIEELPRRGGDETKRMLLVGSVDDREVAQATHCAPASRAARSGSGAPPPRSHSMGVSRLRPGRSRCRSRRPEQRSCHPSRHRGR